MSANPFRIIRSDEQPPEHLRKEVMGSVRLLVLLLRFAQLFAADAPAAIFEQLRLAGRAKRTGKAPDKP